MPSDTATVLAYIGAFVGLFGGAIALFNARKAVAWKRAELASGYLRDLTSNQELVFACRALDWNGGKLVVPEQLRPLLDSNQTTIIHDPKVMARAMSPGLTLVEMGEDPRIQIYRTALDSLLSWLSLVDNALERGLFSADDVKDVGYWIIHIRNVKFIDQFITEFGYKPAAE